METVKLGKAWGGKRKGAKVKCDPQRAEALRQGGFVAPNPEPETEQGENDG